MKGLTLTNNNVLVFSSEPSQKREATSFLVLTEESPFCGYVVKVGPGVRSITPGTKVYFNKEFQALVIQGQTVKMMRADNITAYEMEDGNEVL